MAEADAVLLDDFDNPVGARIDQNGTVVHDRIAIVADAIFRGHIVIGDAFLGQYRADPHLLVIPIRRTMLLDCVTAKARALIDAKDPVDATDHTANNAADDGSEGTGGSFAFSRTSLNAIGDALLRLRHDGQGHCGRKGSNSDNTADHDIS